MGRSIVAVIGGGGRESALVSGYIKSHKVDSVLAFPGNDLMKAERRKHVQTFPNMGTTDAEAIVEACRSLGVTFADVAQDNAVERDLVGALEKAGIPALGPRRDAGMIEWSKAFQRSFGEKHDLPQPRWMSFDSEEEGIDYVKSMPEEPLFIKADGLCEGKGAIPAKDRKEAVSAIREMKEFKDGAGKVFLVEEWLRGDDGTDGEEFSAFGLSDGKRIINLGYAQDHKRVNNFDEGRNTGGTGCSSKPMVITEEIKTEVNGIFERTIEGLRSEGKEYRGVLYLGGMLVKRKGVLRPYVIEYNSRWGDPEAQVILPGIKNDLLFMGAKAASGDLSNFKFTFDGKVRVAVAGMSRGYPWNYEGAKGKRIFGLERAMRMDHVEVFGAGVKVVEGKHYAFGGRLFYVVGEGRDVIEARERAYHAMAGIHIEGNNLHYRTDIGWRDVERLNALRRV